MADVSISDHKKSRKTHRKDLKKIIDQVCDLDEECINNFDAEDVQKDDLFFMELLAIKNRIKKREIENESKR